MSRSEVDFDTIEVAADGRRGTIALNRPNHLNPLSSHTLREIAQAALWFNTQPDVRVVVVTGNGRAFSAGADVSSFGVGDDGDVDPRDDADSGRIMAEAMERMRAVSIARMNGACVGGGLVLAAVCDLRICVDDAYMSIPEIDLGIPLAWGGIPRLVREIGPALTKELVMTCRPFTAAEALAAGFLNRVVTHDELDEVVEELASSLASKPRHALLSTKASVNAVTEGMVGTQRHWSDADGLLMGLRDPEGRASAEAYLERVRSRKH
ncbi:MAG: enoyl-CoA hydratase/isomerase family protein [Actinomycetia bacterium]|nr:enoyl-CoA hydratase/isomerase family protein [Actinomycetes bacterium]MCP4963562.1 enoyl-CoA hydratase/isomerase family protein [Actinomycetes bacterium]